MRACVHFGKNLKQYDNMSEQDSQSSPMRTTEASHRNSTTLKDSMDEGAANNSIIGKVKSRVSSIFPNSLSKWFSPSSAKNNNNDSPNGSVSVGGITRRRRRLDIDEDDDDDDEDIDDEDAEDDDGDEEHELGEYDENLLGHQQDDEDNSDDESNNSEEANAAITTSGFKIASRREALRPCATAVRQPPSKRSRFNFDITTPTTTIRNTPLMQRQQIVSSTPATGGNNFRATSINLSTGTGMGRSAANRYTHLNLYGNQGRKEAAFNFQSSSITNTNLTLLGGRSVTDPIELETEQANQANLQSDIMSSRRSLNIPPATLASTERYAGLSNLKRQALSNIKHEYSNTSSLPRRTSTTIFENDDGDDYTEPQQRSSQQLHEAQLERAVNEDDEYDTQQSKSFNGRLIDNVAYKRQKLTNGADDALTITAETFIRAGAANLRDSASESSDGGVNSGVADSVGVVGLTAGRAETAGSSGQAKRRAAGLFNLSAANSSRNGSRTSSFGNGLNFYTHLEGRKSLFAGTQSAANGQQNLNNSTLSLTSLNRRQFNASIYGSTSALSDSRLLNTFSPFYKGKTTYGGASAYNKYSLLGTGAGANSAVRITPTLIRPTSSLSTLSSSNNSLTAAAVGANVSAENSSALSSTAKRILDLINDFATPLSDAKKMASNLKASQQQQNQPQFAKSRRFNDADLNTTRAVRLSQVRSPYMRPTVTLHPTPKTNLSKHNTVLPPVRELQVPSMSQLLQMKKMQSTTERSRQIATENSYKITAQQPLAATSLSEYTLPVELHSDKQKQQQNQKHTNKIKNKVTSSVRVTASKDAVDDAPPFTVNLPNIAFPIMQSAPKFDISLPNTSITKSPTSSALGGGDAAKSSFGKNETVSTIAFKAIDVVDNTTKKVVTTAIPGISTTLPKTNFRFSAPLQLDGIYPQNVSHINGNYKFSAPMFIQKDGSTSQNIALNSPVNQSQSSSVQLKSGSVLDALKKPLTITTTKTQSSADNSLASQFKKSTNEWDCDTCMIRNKQELSKCAACETPRKSTAPVVQTISPLTSLNPVVSGFGNQFKKISSEWECDACMIRNKQDTNKCVACETSRTDNSGNSSSSSKKSSVSFPGLVSGPSFGDTFKPIANTWECPTCLVNNKNESFECVACQTKKTGSINSVAAEVKIDVPPVSSDDGFVSLAASQKASKWECEACMTRNDTTRLKCVCCEQAKPGSQTVSDDVPKFSFGSTAAAKFSFGFGGATSTAPKEAELRKNENAEKKTDTTTTTITAPSTGFVFGKAVSSIPNQIPGFTFGVKPVDDASSSETKDIAKDVADSSKPSVLTDFKFGNTTPSSLVTSNVSTSTTTATTTTAGLTSATNIDTVSTITTSTPNVVKFSSPTSITVASKNSKAAPTFTFGSSSTPATSTSNPVQQPTSGFSFGLSKPSETAAVDAVNRAAKETPTNGGFAFNAPVKTATPTNTLTFGITPATTTVTTTIAAPTATIKPLFSFSSTTPSTSTSTASAAQTTLSNTAQSTGGFSFGHMAASSSTPTEKKSLFGAAIAPTSTTTSAAPTTSVTKNVFGSFGAAPTTSNVFGVAAAPSTTSSSTTTAAAFNTSSTFGSLASSTAVSSSPQFGIFSNSETAGKSKPTTLFGASSSVIPSPNTPFAFGSTTATNSNAITTTPSTTWPKNSFVFGSPAAVAPTPVMSNETSKQTQQQQHSFGGFGTSSTPASIVNPTASSSIFGNLATVAPTTGTFGSVAGATPIFSSNSSVTSAGSSGSVNNNNLFGSATTLNSSNSTSAFGITPFGGGSSALANTFGSAATASSGGPPTSNSFGGFGSLSSASIAGNTTDGASAAKKSDTTFSFGGANQAASQSASGGFNFGSSAAIAKPAFNFGASTAATPGSFNFTGSVETTKSTTQPFQFGATPLAPVFNFSGGAAVETTPNAPFQFNAGAASPAASNIFAPAASVPGTQSAQQTRRKIRAPTRRLTPR